MRLSNESAFLAILVMTAVTFATRAFPFAVFGTRKPGRWFRVIETNLPPMLIAILAAYAVAGTAGPDAKTLFQALIAIAATIGIHLSFKNAFFSIAGGTAAYMALTYLLP